MRMFDGFDVAKFLKENRKWKVEFKFVPIFGIDLVVVDLLLCLIKVEKHTPADLLILLKFMDVLWAHS